MTAKQKLDIHCICVYVWHECQASRGAHAQEIASCIQHYVQSELKMNPGKSELVTWSDSCGGQNRNIKMTLLILKLVCSRNTHTHTHTHTHLTALSLELPRWAGTRKGKPIGILMKYETVSGSGISRAMCKSAPCSRQITLPAVFYRPDALPATLPTASKH